MGAEASKAEEGSPQAASPRRRSNGSGGSSGSDAAQLAQLQARIRDLETSLKQPQQPQPSATAWHDVLAREPTVGSAQLTPETCTVVDSLFAALDVNGDGVLSAADIPSRKDEVHVRGRAARLFQPLSDFLINGEMTKEELRRALAARAARQTVAAPSSSDSLAGWIAAIQLEANRWVQQTVHEVLHGGGSVSRAPRSGDASALVDMRPPCVCSPLEALVLAFGNLGFPTSHEAMIAATELPLWAMQYARMSLGETFYVARLHAERSGIGCYVSMQHVGSGTQLDDVNTFRKWLAVLARETAKGETVTAVLVEPSTAFGNRNLEGSERHVASVHAVLLDAYDEASDEVTLLDTQPQKYGLRWRCRVERLHLACSALLHDASSSALCTGGIVSLSRVALASKGLQASGNGRDIESISAPSGQIDCFSRPSQPQQMPTLPTLSPHIPCRGLITLSAALSVLEQRESRPKAGEEADPGCGNGVATICPSVDELCYTLGLGFQAVVDTEQPTLAELADLASRWIAKRNLSAEAVAIHCDDRIRSVDTFAMILRKWQSSDPDLRPIYLIQFDSSTMSKDGAPAGKGSVCLAILVKFDEVRSEVTLGEASIRHSARAWTLPLKQLWEACAAVGSIYRSGGVLQLATQAEVNADSATQYCAAKAAIRDIQLPQFGCPIPATGLTSIAYALEALFQVAVTAVSHSDSGRPSIPTNLRRPVSVDDVVSVSLSAAAVNRVDFSMAETFDAAARFVVERNLPVRVDAIFCDGSISETVFREELLKRAVSSSEVLVLHLDPNLARGIELKETASGSSALVLGYDQEQDEVVLADTNPKMYRAEWRASVSNVYKACCAVAPSTQRARGAIRYSIYSRHHDVARLQERVEGSAAAAAVNTGIAPPGIVSTLNTCIAAPADAPLPLVHGPEALSAVAMAIFLALGQNESCATAVEVARVCEVPIHCAFAPDWELADLAAVARRYIELKQLPLAVQHVEFSQQTNPANCLVAEMERTKHVDKPEAHIFAFSPSAAHSAPDLDGCDYAVLSSIDITSSTLQLTDMNPKKNCLSWSVQIEQLFEALSISPPVRSKSTYGMLRIHQRFEKAAELLFMSTTPERPLILTNLALSADTKLNHGALVLQTAFAQQLKCSIGVLLALSVERIAQHEESLPELRDLALCLAHRHLELHDFTIDTVFCEPEHCTEEQFSLEMRRHCEATGLGFLEASILHFDTATVFGARASEMGLQKCDWAMCVAADEKFVGIVTFDGVEHKVPSDRLYLALSEKDGATYTSRRMGFFRMASVTSAQVHATRFETERVDGPVAWALAGERLERSSPETFDQVVITEDNMLHPPEHHFDSQAKEFQLDGLTLLASLVPTEFALPVPCSSLVAIGLCCDALLERYPAVGATDSSGKTWWEPHEPETTLDTILQAVGSFSLGIAQAMSLKISGPLAASELFQRRHTTPAPVPTVSVGLVQATLLANQFFSATGNGLTAEMHCFGRAPSDSESFANALSAAFASSGTESVNVAPRELLIAFFRADIVHAAAGAGGCSVAIVVGYLEESDTVLLLNAQPKKFGRFTRVSTQRLRKASMDDNSDEKAHFGVLQVRVTAKEPGQAAQAGSRAQMPRAQRLWRRAIIGVRFMLRVVNSSAMSKTKAEALVHWRHLRHHMPCNGLAALAYSLSATGVATSLMSIVALLRLPVQVLLSPKLTLGQLSTIAQQYIAVRALPLKAAAVHFDAGSKAERCFKDAVMDIADLDAKDMLILNFDAAMASSRNGVERNGWGILSEVDSGSDTIAVLDPVATSEQDFRFEVGINRIGSALRARDSTVQRARGVLHIYRSNVDDGRAQACADISLAESCLSVAALNRWVARWPTSRHQICGAVQHGSTTMHGLPCHSLTALAMGLTLVGGGSSAELHSQDKIVQRLALPPHIALRDMLTLGEIATLAAEYIRQAGLAMSVELIHFDIGAVTRGELAAELQRLCDVRDSDSDGADLQEIHIVSFDVDRAHGQFGLTGGESHHALLFDFDSENEQLIMADPHPARFGQVWASKLDHAFDGITARDSTGRAHGLVRLTSTLDGDKPMALRSHRVLDPGNLSSIV